MIIDGQLLILSPYLIHTQQLMMIVVIFSLIHSNTPLFTGYEASMAHFTVNDC